MSKHQIIIVDDHPLFRDALRHALTSSLPDVEILEADSLDSLTSRLSSMPDVDLVLLDLKMPGVRGFSGLMYLRAQHPELPVVVVSASDSAQTIRQCMRFGASGFVPKSLPVERIREAITSVIAGDVWTPSDFDPNASEEGDDNAALISRLATLTPQQVRVLMMLAEGLLNKQIAFELGVSEATIKAHVSAILQKLDVDSRTQAVIALNKIENDDWRDISNQ